MTRVLLLCGGISSEHCISLRSAAAVLAALDRTDFSPHTVYITRTGGWLYLPEAAPATLAALERSAEEAPVMRERPATAERPLPDEAFPALLSPNREAPGLYYKTEAGLRRLIPDVILPLTHGGEGESGALFGLLSLSGVPYVGPSVGGAAAAWNKATAKTLAAAVGIPTLPHLLLSPEDGRDMPALVLRVAQSIGFPAFLKPVAEGSSVGASPALRAEEFPPAFRHAAACGGQVMVEPYLPAREIEVAVITQNGRTETAPAAEINPPPGRFYDYAAKYREAGATLRTRADIPPSLDTRVRLYAKRIFEALGLSSLSRVDFFLAPDGETLYFNEVNTLPGMTEHSMFPRTLTASRSFSELLSLLLREAMR